MKKQTRKMRAPHPQIDWSIVAKWPRSSKWNLFGRPANGHRIENRTGHQTGLCYLQLRCKQVYRDQLTQMLSAPRCTHKEPVRIARKARHSGRFSASQTRSIGFLVSAKRYCPTNSLAMTAVPLKAGYSDGDSGANGARCNDAQSGDCTNRSPGSPQLTQTTSPHSPLRLSGVGCRKPGTPIAQTDFARSKRAVFWRCR